MLWFTALTVVAIALLFLAGLLRFLNKPQPKPKRQPQVFEDAFEGFVGNAQSVRLLRRLIKHAHQTQIVRLPPLAFFGPKSVGKTELSKRIAKGLGISMVPLTEGSLKNEKTIFECLSAFSGMSIVIFIDEVHMLSRKAQDLLLTGLENDTRSIHTKFGDLDVSSVTWIVATTNPGKLSEAFRSRFTVFNLQQYCSDEIVQILQSRIAQNPKEFFHVKNIDRDGLLAIAKMSRNVPRQAIAMLKQIDIGIATNEVRPNKDAIVKDVTKSFGCDEYGLAKNDYAYINCLAKHRVLGVNALVASLGLERDYIEQVIEPYLVQLGIIKMTPKGRMLSDDMSVAFILSAAKKNDEKKDADA